MTRNRLYLITGVLLAAGYGWLLYAWDKAHRSDFTPCIFKNTTGIACPSCGNTRSVLAVAHGDFADALLINPLGLLLALLMMALPFWIVYDLAAKKDTFYKSFRKFEQTAGIRWVAIVLVVLIILNWAWNIHKGL
ncbi:DUF2752 domain-containing protein [Flavobacterium sp. MFBS3-15]|uniref:DUF2752 domain-containing protein n=1 Tax=Flavobacterium sp. MFBS3-15 TaxID=2989816 RepID=UPI002235860A|nr:DUF2752 domain-containing protein [Flavobacterium sp. MFBS3-15]MCW4467826.1 DUF2752 domain-containing protein [Flavobacterium sp. MFBS3-15]